LNEAGISVDAFNLLVPASLKVTGPDRNAGALVEYMKVACSRAAELGGKVLIFGSAGARQAPVGYDIEIAAQEIVDFLKSVADIVKNSGLELVIEPLEKAACNIVNSVNEGVEIVKRVGRADVINVLSDLYHVTQDGQSFTETANAGPLLRHVHVACGADRHPPAWQDSGELISYFLALTTAGYDERVSIEAHWEEFEPAAAEALEVLNHCWSAASGLG